MQISCITVIWRISRCVDIIEIFFGMGYIKQIGKPVLISSELQVIRLYMSLLTLLHSEWPKLYGVLAVLSAIGLRGLRRFSKTFKKCFLVSFGRQLPEYGILGMFTSDCSRTNVYVTNVKCHKIYKPVNTVDSRYLDSGYLE